MKLITAAKQADMVDLFLLALPVLMGALLVALCVTAIVSGDSHAGQHCTQHVLMPTKVGNTTIYNNLCTEWSK